MEIAGYEIPKAFIALMLIGLVAIYFVNPYEVDEKVSGLFEKDPKTEDSKSSATEQSGITQAEAQRNLRGEISWNDASKSWQNSTHGYGANGLFLLAKTEKPPAEKPPAEKPPAEGTDMYGVPKLSTLAQDQSAYSNLILRLKAQYPGYTLKEYDRGRMRIASEEWVDNMFSGVESYSLTGKHSDDWNSQTRKGELDDNTVLYLYKVNGDGWDLVVPATMTADDTDTQAVEMKARNSNLADFEKIPVAQGNSKASTPEVKKPATEEKKSSSGNSASDGGLVDGGNAPSANTADDGGLVG